MWNENRFRISIFDDDPRPCQKTMPSKHFQGITDKNFDNHSEIIYYISTFSFQEENKHFKKKYYRKFSHKQNIFLSITVCVMQSFPILSIRMSYSSRKHLFSKVNRALTQSWSKIYFKRLLHTFLALFEKCDSTSWQKNIFCLQMDL